MESISMMLAGLYCATAIDSQASWPIFLCFHLEFQALSGQSLAIVTRALETLGNWSQESVSCRFEKGKEFLVWILFKLFGVGLFILTPV